MADESGMDWDDGISEGIGAAGISLRGILENVALEFAEKIETYAQENAPWTDRTGDARAGLTVDVDSAGNHIDIILFHSVEYGLYLETIQSGRWAIIMPTLEHFAPMILSNAHLEDGGDLE